MVKYPERRVNDRECEWWLEGEGHPLGATGTGQVVEVVQQTLRGKVEPDRQVRDANIGLTHNVGGSGATCAVHVLGRDRA